MTSYRVLYADPPWPHSDKLPGPGRGAAKHYSLMSTHDIMCYELPPMKENAWLFLWRVHTHQVDAFRVMKAWGFEYASEVVWKKTTVHGKRHFGMGRTTRMEHEVCLIGKRGYIRSLSNSVRSIIEAPIGRHSEKPEEMRYLIHRISGGPYCELFARCDVPGWDRK